MSAPYDIYEIGDQILITTGGPFQNDSGVPVDPNTVTITIRAFRLPAPLVYTYGAPDATVVKDGVGLYHMWYTATEAGMHSGTITGVGGVTRSVTKTFLVKMPPF